MIIKGEKTMTQKAMTFKEIKDVVNTGISTIEELQGHLEGEQFRQAGEVSSILGLIRSMLEDKVLIYNRKREQKLIDNRFK